MRNSQRKNWQEVEHKVRYPNGRRVTIECRGCSDMLKDVSEEFQAFLCLLRKTLPLLSAKNDMLKYLPL